MHDDLSSVHQSYSDKSEKHFGNYKKEQISKQEYFQTFSLLVDWGITLYSINNKALYNLL